MHQIFGNSSAAEDELLYECRITHASPAARKPILTGRWGSGKTAILMLDGLVQSEKLAAKDRTLARAWYIRENSLDLAALEKLRASLDGDAALLERTLEAAWRAEIVRAYCRVLTELSPGYADTQGPHWAFVRRTAKAGATVRSVWAHVGQFVGLVTGDLTRATAADDLGSALANFADKQSVGHVVGALQTIRQSARELIPVVAIEPIETPTSPIESRTSLANELVSALLNVFHQSFQPTNTNNLNVRLTLPWHRYDPSRVDAPQKIRQYFGRVRWTKNTLRQFINKRIEWEFKRVGRRFTPRRGHDAWSELFGNKIPNGVCTPRVFEDSFGYFLRHTHHRPRELQTLARCAVEAQAEESRCSEEDVLRKSSPTINPMVAKGRFKVECPLSTRELLVEAHRRYSDLKLITDELHGLPNPFSMEQLKKRLSGLGADLNESLDLLWSSGVTGVTGVPETTEASRWLAATFQEPEECRQLFRNENDQALERWSWFEYNTYGGPVDLLRRLQGRVDVRSGLILHSKTLEHFAPQTVDKSIPIGI